MSSLSLVLCFLPTVLWWPLVQRRSGLESLPVVADVVPVTGSAVVSLVSWLSRCVGSVACQTLSTLILGDGLALGRAAPAVSVLALSTPFVNGELVVGRSVSSVTGLPWSRVSMLDLLVRCCVGLVSKSLPSTGVFLVATRQCRTFVPTRAGP